MGPNIQERRRDILQALIRLPNRHHSTTDYFLSLPCLPRLLRLHFNRLRGLQKVSQSARAIQQHRCTNKPDRTPHATRRYTEVSLAGLAGLVDALGRRLD